MKKWLFVFSEQPGSAGWWLKLKTPEELEEYQNENRYFADDLKHYRELQDGRFRHNDMTLKAHSEFGFVAVHLKNEYGLSAGMSYALLQDMQKNSMVRAMDDGHEIYVNRKGGFCCGLEPVPGIFVRREKPEFPRYYSQDIRIETFPDGTHFYAYVGDVQVRDGGIIKWDSYEEAYSQACRFLAPSACAHRKDIRCSEK